MLFLWDYLGGIVLDLVHKIVKCREKYYYVDSVDLEGFLLSREVSELGKSKCRSERLDPLTSSVVSLDWECIGYEDFSRLELDFMRRIDGYIDLSDINYVVGYYGKTGRYLIVVFTNSNTTHIMDIDSNSVYGIVLNKGRIDLSTGLFDLHDVRSKITDEYVGVDWVRYAKLYKMFYKPTSDVLETLGRLFFGFERCRKVILPVLKDICEGTVLKLFSSERSLVISTDCIKDYIFKKEIITRDVLNEYMNENFSKPCPSFEGEELEKVLNILKIHGYGFLIEEFKKNNGSISNYPVECREDYLCIRDSSLRSSYSLHLLRVVPVRSYAGIIMYYELRLYPLCDNGRYLVMYSSIYREKCEELLKYKNANLIRGSLLKFKGYPFEITSLVDSGDSVSIRYTIRGNKTIYNANYNKVSSELENIEFSDTGLDKDFIDLVLKVFDKKADLLKIPETEFFIYRASGRKFILNTRHCIAIKNSFEECLSFLRSLCSNEEYLIVARESNREVNNWIFNQKTNSLINV